MNWIDWSIVGSLLILFIGFAAYTNRYTKSIADFLAANRCASRYMLAVSADASSLGALTILALFELYYKGGFSAIWWSMMTMPITIIIALSGWVIYRYRQTKAMTLAQFFEIRYSRKFRIFAGILCFIAGVLNFGIFPSAGARFLIYFCNLPEQIIFLGINFDSYAILMAGLLLVALYFTFGGQITVMVTDFIQGMFCNIFFALIIVFLLFSFDWSSICQGLISAPKNASLVNPYNSHGVKDFNISYFLILAFGSFYNFMAWQGSSAYNCSAINPHEQKMGRALGHLRALTHILLFVLLPIIVYAIMHNPEYQSQAQQINESVSRIEDSYMQQQMLVPIAASKILKTGLLGMMCTIMIAAFITVHDTYLHSWGSIFIQDVILPLRGKAFAPKQHLRLLKMSICGVAVFAYFWSLWFKQNESILLYFALTASIYLGGAGAIIIGGLYWNRGTTTAAWCTMICGSVLGIAGLVIKQIYPAFPLNGQVLSFLTMLTSIIVYISVSFLGGGKKFDLDKMLHRGKYADSEDVSGQITEKRGILAKLGITADLNLKDKLTVFSCLGWTLLWFSVFAVGTILHIIMGDISDKIWLKFWQIWVFVSLIVSALVTVWLTIGGLKDMIDLFKRLKASKTDIQDDGIVREKDNTEDPSEKIEDSSVVPVKTS